jgi:hypothetical protein
VVAQNTGFNAVNSIKCLTLNTIGYRKWYDGSNSQSGGSASLDKVEAEKSFVYRQGSSRASLDARRTKNWSRPEWTRCASFSTKYSN